MTRHVTYDSASKASKVAGEDNDCAVIAVAIATGESYDLVRGMMWALGRTPRLGTPREITIATLELLGWAVRNVPVTRQTGRLLPTVAKRLNPTSIYLVSVSNKQTAHIFCVKRGKREDYKGHNTSKVNSILLVERPQCRVCQTTVGTSLVILPPETWPSIPPWFRAYLVHKNELHVICGKNVTCRRLCEKCASAAWGIPAKDVPHKDDRYSFLYYNQWIESYEPWPNKNAFSAKQQKESTPGKRQTYSCNRPLILP